MPVTSLLTALTLLAVTSCVGCIEVEETLTLRADGSGKVQMRVLFPQVALRWLPGEPAADWLRPPGCSNHGSRKQNRAISNRSEGLPV